MIGLRLPRISGGRRDRATRAYRSCIENPASTRAAENRVVGAIVAGPTVTCSSASTEAVIGAVTATADVGVSAVGTDRGAISAAHTREPTSRRGRRQRSRIVGVQAPRSARPPRVNAERGSATMAPGTRASNVGRTPTSLDGGRSKGEAGKASQDPRDPEQLAPSHGPLKRVVARAIRSLPDRGDPAASRNPPASESGAITSQRGFDELHAARVSGAIDNAGRSDDRKQPPRLITVTGGSLRGTARGLSANLNARWELLRGRRTAPTPTDRAICPAALGSYQPAPSTTH